MADLAEVPKSELVSRFERLKQRVSHVRAEAKVAVLQTAYTLESMAGGGLGTFIDYRYGDTMAGAAGTAGLKEHKIGGVPSVLAAGLLVKGLAFAGGLDEAGPHAHALGTGLLTAWGCNQTRKFLIEHPAK